MIRLRTSLFRHIVLWYTICAMLTFAIYTLILYGEVRRGRELPFDVRLDAIGARVAGDLRHEQGLLDIALVEPADLSNRYVAVYSTDWQLLLASMPWQHVSWSTSDARNAELIERTSAGKRYHRQWHDSAGRDMRISIAAAAIAPLDETAANARPLPVYVLAADVFEPLDQFLWRQKYRMALAFVAICLATLVSGLIVARLGTRPIKLLAATAEHITPEDSSTRLPVAVLPHELRLPAQRLNEAFDRLDAALQAERNFTAAAAHEMRTPLAALVARLQHIRQDAALPSNCVAQMDNVLHDAERLRRLSGRLLLLARLDRAAAGEPFATSKVDLAELTQDVVDGLNDAAVSRDVHVHLRSLGQVTVEAHEEWMLRALHNVINNAIKYTEPATNVVIDIEPTADASAVMVSVSDAGPGIAPNERRHVLQRFYRGVRTHATEGTGLGLAIVHDVMRALGGDVMIAEGPGGKGARITLVVPVTPRPGGRRH